VAIGLPPQVLLTIFPLPPALSPRELRKLVLGPDSPWARTPTRQGVTSITRADLQARAPGRRALPRPACGTRRA
jgi:hypothetical protein